jgi:hypothetical protein
MKKARGAVLAITVGFIAVFTMFGVSSIYLSGLQNQFADQKIFSAQAFWLAEAGINRAIRDFSVVPQTNPFNSTTDTEIVRGYGAVPDIYRYDVIFVTDMEPWIISSTGTVGPVSSSSQVRKVEISAIRALDQIDTIIKCGGPLDEQGDSEITGKKESEVAVNDDLFYDLFNLRQSDFKVSPSTQILPFGNDPPGVAGSTWIDCGGNELRITSTSWTGSGLLVVDGDLKITGGAFNGIIWVKGDLRIDGNPPIAGSIFVEGKVTLNVGGTPNIVYDIAAIELALSSLAAPPTYGYKLQLVPGSWKEKP